MADPAEQADAPQPPVWLTATADDFAATDINAPLAAAKTIDCTEASSLLGAAANAAEAVQRHAEYRAYSMLGSIASFYFKPENQAEPYGPMMRFEGKRTAQPDDFSKAIAQMLAAQLERVSHPGLRARLADLVWIVDRKQHAAAAEAVAAYAAIVDALVEKSATLRRGQADEHGHEVPQFLRRALQIGKAIGWDKDVVLKARGQVAALRKSSVETAKTFSHIRFATLDLDYQISDPIEIATDAQRLAATADSEDKHRLLHLAARAHRAAKNQTGRDACLVDAAEALVAVAEAQKHSAMAETHWLEKAINELRRLPAAKERMRVLKHRLVDTQARVLDEMQSMSTTDDISELIDNARAAVTGKKLSQVLRVMARATRSPAPKQLRDEALRSISEHPLSSLFGSTHNDHDGKPVHRTSGGGIADGNDEAVLEHMARSEKIRRSLVVASIIEPARQTIILEHTIAETQIAILCRHSVFVPDDREALFVAGLLHFFHGDMIAALHILLPQLENSLRHVLRLHGHDVIKLNEDMTQESFGLTQMLTRLRPELETIFGDAVLAEIDSLFLYRGGPQLRDRTSHGLLHHWEPFGHDAIYACWLVYRQLCIPLLPHWGKLAPSLDQ